MSVIYAGISAEDAWKVREAVTLTLRVSAMVTAGMATTRMSTAGMTAAVAATEMPTAAASRLLGCFVGFWLVVPASEEVEAAWLFGLDLATFKATPIACEAAIRKLVVLIAIHWRAVRLLRSRTCKTAPIVPAIISGWIAVSAIAEIPAIHRRADGLLRARYRRGHPIVGRRARIGKLTAVRFSIAVLRSALQSSLWIFVGTSNKTFPGPARLGQTSTVTIVPRAIEAIARTIAAVVVGAVEVVVIAVFLSSPTRRTRTAMWKSPISDSSAMRIER